MKILALLLATAPVTAPPANKPLTIMGTTIALTQACDLEVTRDKKTTVTTDLPKAPVCEFAPHGGTDVPNLVVIKKHYVFLVQTKEVVDPQDWTGCRISYRAVSVSPTGQVRVGSERKARRACDGDHDRTELEYLSRAIVKSIN